MIARILPVFLCISLFVFGQDDTFTYVEYDTISNGYLEMKIDSKMDDLLESKRNRCDVMERYRQAAASSASATSVKKKPVRINDLCRENPKLRGFRIQVINTRSSEEAEKAQRKIQQQFPGLSSQVVSRVPQFKVLLGDYFYKESAASDLTAVKRLYPGAILVVSKIWCNRAK